MVSWQGQSPATIFLPSYFIFYRHERYKATRQRKGERERQCPNGGNSGELVNLRAAFLRWMHISSAVRGSIVARIHGQLVLTRAQKGEEGAMRIHRVGDYQCNALVA